jgi:hypothetical protein
MTIYVATAALNQPLDLSHSWPLSTPVDILTAPSNDFSPEGWVLSEPTDLAKFFLRFHLPELRPKSKKKPHHRIMERPRLRLEQTQLLRARTPVLPNIFILAKTTSRVMANKNVLRFDMLRHDNPLTKVRLKGFFLPTVAPYRKLASVRSKDDAVVW